MAFKRNEGKNNADYSLKDLYKEYKSKVEKPLPYKVYSEVLKEYNERIIKAVIYESLEFKFPYKLGFLRIKKKKKIPYMKDGKLIKRHISPDWKRTLTSWRNKWPELTDEEIKNIPDKKVLLHHNDHSNGYSCTFFWDKIISNAKNQTSYVFKATRTAKETLASFIKSSRVLEYFE